MTTISNAKTVLTHSVFLLSAVFGGWIASAILSTPLTEIEHAMIRPCEDDACGSIFLTARTAPMISVLMFACATTGQVLIAICRRTAGVLRASVAPIAVHGGNFGVRMTEVTLT